MKIHRIALIALPALFFLLPFSASAATKSSFVVSGWLPYWSAASSTADAIAHMNELTLIDPFVYSVQNDGSISDLGPMNQAPWTTVVAAAKADRVLVVPTVMWSNGAAIQTILSNTKSRIALEDSITALVKQNNYDGIDIDFENKEAATENYFSTFLMGLYERMGTKLVTCDIEARTPISAEYYGTTVPATAGQYANDFAQINKYCDEVRIMAYDQQGADLQLSAAAASSSQLYAPVADPAWVEAVVALAEQQISPSKIMIGVPTYGYEYDVTAYANNEYDYNILWTFNPGYATQIEQQYGVSPTRTGWGEEELTYTPVSSSTVPSTAVPLTALTAATAASLYATSYNSHLNFHLLDWPDAQSILDKVDLAKAMGVHGIALFEINGGEDPNIWTVLQGVKK